MARIRLWRYKKLTNEIVKEKSSAIEKHSDDEDYNSCFKLGKTLKSSCRNFIMKHQETRREKAPENFNDDRAEGKFINKLKEQRKDELEARAHRKTFQKCLNKILKRNCTRHDAVQQKLHEEPSPDAYVAFGIYERFGSSCTESLKQSERVKRVSTEDLSSVSWFHSGIVGNFALELLQHQKPGSFIIHRASLKSDTFVLSLRVSSPQQKVVHHLIVNSNRGYRLKGAKKVFPTLTSLVTHHSVMSEQLPLTLLLQKTYILTKGGQTQNGDNDDFCPLEGLDTAFTGLEV